MATTGQSGGVTAGKRRRGRRWIGAACVLSGLAIAGAAGLHRHEQPGGAGDRAGVPPVVQWSGHKTERRQDGFLMIADAAAWKRLWGEHTGQPMGEGSMQRNNAPRIDFERSVVVAYFRGETTNRDGETARDVLETPEHLRVRFVGDTFQTAGPGGGAAPTRSFGIWVLPRTGKPILVEEGRRRLKDEPLRWQEVATLPPS